MGKSPSAGETKQVNPPFSGYQRVIHIPPPCGFGATTLITILHKSPFPSIFDKKLQNMQSIIIIPKSKKSGLFLQKLLSQLNDVKSIEIIEDKEEKPFVELSESSLQKEWNSLEDNIWDVWAEKKLKNAI
jgi:hypothetical protein